ncbi:FecR domain-containing protein [Reichenbachiella sp. MALMAid0571]|uniref:FecR family protein n=1 Tax=Reichenbachiella sp. MALMAid0571 TaxID=3143939 RepID=UPI0032DF2573
MPKNYNHINDFITDQNFKSWAKNPTAENTDYWMDWLSNNEDSRELFFQAKEVINGFKFQNPKVSDLKEQAILNTILNREQKESPHSKRYWIYTNSFLRIAAVLFIAFSFILYQYLSESNTANKVAYEIITKSNPSGIKTKIKLPDGTGVWLNALSSISYVEGFADSVRGVNLQGEAFFEVEKDTTKPFMVVLDRLTVQALGTAFDIDGFDQREVKVYLTEGSVKVTQNSDQSTQTTFLSQGEMVISELSTNTLSKDTFLIDEVIAWTENEIVFKKATFDEVIKVLSRWYGVEFEVVNPKRIGKWSYSSRFKKQSLKQVLEVISKTEHFKFEITDKKVILTF